MPNRLMSLLFPAPAVRSAPPKQKAPAATVVAVEIDGRTIPVTLRRNPRARRYTLRLAARGDAASLTIPKRGTLAEAKAFLARHTDWLAERTASAVPAGDLPETVPILGIRHRLEAAGTTRGVVRAASDADGTAILTVPGDPRHVRRRVETHLRSLARRELTSAVGRHASTLGVRPAAIRIKDTTSRWGSASSTGTLCFSWRLAMAPPFVLDYLAAHEVAHLVEMNHSDRFWAICRRLAPRTEEARAWLKAHGHDLHRAL